MSTEQAHVRPTAVEDLEAIAGIFARYVVESVATFEEVPPTVAHWRRRLDDLASHSLPFLAAEVGGEVVGYAYASPWRPKPAYRYTVEDTVYVAPEWTGIGLGRLLLDELLAQCVQVGVRQMIAVVADTGDPTSAALHYACGFVEAGRLRAVGRKHDRWVDTLLLQRDLTTGGLR